jgi:cholest-4-en-3-one 26-monooxygenase
MTGAREADLFDPHLYEHGLPHDLFASLRDDRPCYRHELDHPVLVDSAWVVSRHEDVQALLRDATTFVNGEGPTLGRRPPVEAGDPSAPITHRDGPDHVRLRRAVLAGFTPRAIRVFEERFALLADEAVAAAAERGTVDFITDVATPLSVHAIAEVLGLPDGERARLLAWIDAYLDPARDLDPVALGAVLQELGAYSLDLVADFRRDPRDGVLSEIANRAELVDAELVALFQIFFLAGSEPARNAMGHGLQAVLADPALLDWLRAHADHLPDTFVEEVLRMATPFLYLRRTATAEVSLHGCTIRPGDPVALLLASANHDPRGFADPLTMDPERDPNPHLAFGSGAHFCLGAHVARLEIRLLFEAMLRGWRDVRQAGPAEHVPDIFRHGMRRLPIVVEA